MNRQEALKQLTYNLGWTDIDTLVELAQKAGLYDDPEFRKNALTKAIKADLRSMMRKIKDRTGFPIFASIKQTDEDGEEKEFYKQEALFDINDYDQTCRYHLNRGRYHINMAKEYYKRCENRFKVQLAIKFPDIDNVA